VHRHLHLQLARPDLAMALCVLFVDELDGENGIFLLQGRRFLDAVLAAISLSLLVIRCHYY
jgi:hypothetical protein